MNGGPEADTAFLARMQAFDTRWNALGLDIDRFDPWAGGATGGNAKTCDRWRMGRQGELPTAPGPIQFRRGFRWLAQIIKKMRSGA